MKKSPDKRYKPCWVIHECPMERRQNCPSWEFRAGHICWFINGTMCHGYIQENWQKKMELCRKCKVFRAMMPRLALLNPLPTFLLPVIEACF
jgi:hypothetical protein